MKCPSCKNEMICGPGEHHYKESGLDNVYLLGIEICECACGEKVFNIPAVTELHRKIAFDLIKKKSLLNGKEIRFLRKSMGLTAINLAKIIGVDNATVSRWEQSNQFIGKAHDRLLRLVYLNIKGIPAKQTEHLIKENFTEILPVQKDVPRYMIPLDEWSKTNICFTK